MSDEQVVTGEAPIAATPTPTEPAPTGAEPAAAPPPAESPPKDDPAAETKKALRGVQKRIDELTRARYDAEERGKQEAEHWRQQALAAAQQLEALKRNSNAPRLDQFQTLEEFTTAAARHESERLIEARLQQERQAFAQYNTEQQRVAQEQAGRAQFMAELNRRVEAAEKKFPGFSEAIQSPELPGLMGTPAFGAMWESEIGDEVMHYLTKNPAKAHQIVSLSPIGQVREIARIEASIQAGRTTSAAPAPPAQVGGSGAGHKKPEDMSLDEFFAFRRRQIAQRR